MFADRATIDDSARTMPDIQLVLDGPKKAALTIALAPGSGQSLQVEMLAFLAKALGQVGLRVARFDFPYMSERSSGGRRRSADPEPVMLDTWRQVVRQLGSPDKLFIGGRSHGGRLAGLVADECQVQGLVCFGFPFHATGKSDQYELAPLDTIQTPTLLLQGEWDTFGDKPEVTGYALSDKVEVKWIREGDHSLQPPKESKRTREENWLACAKLTGRFIMEQTGVELAIK